MSRARNNAYLRSLPDVCKCGHGQLEHYDGHEFCTWIVNDECDCEQYEPAAAHPDSPSVGGASE